MFRVARPLAVALTLAACAGDVTKDGTPAAADPLGGDWSGDCTGTVTGSTSPTDVDLGVDLELVEDGGDVTGVALVTQYGYTSGFRVGGTRVDDAVMLEIIGYTTTTGDREEGEDISFELTLAGDALDGDLRIPASWWGTGRDQVLSCALDRG